MDCMPPPKGEVVNTKMAAASEVRDDERGKNSENPDLENLLLRARKGDERSIERVIEMHRSFTFRRANKYYLRGATNEDVIQEAFVGLFKAIRDYEPDLATPFMVFADICIQRQIQSAVKGANRLKHNPLNRAASLDVVYIDDDSVTTFGDTLPGPVQLQPDALVMRAIEIEEIRDFVAVALTALEKDVFVLLLEGRSYKDMVALLDSHLKAVDNALQRIRTKLRAHMQTRS